MKEGLKKWSPLIVLSLALAIIIIDTTLLNVSLGTIIKDLHTDLESLQWVISAYSLTLAALTITGGRFGDLFGRKRMFMAGAAIFAVGSFITSISHNVPTMIVGEAVVEGIGAALMMPATSSLLVANYKGRDRAIGFGIWGGIAAAASAIGPILGGFLTTHYSWRWGFRINIFVALLLLAGSLIIKESRDQEEKPTIDWLGILLSASGMFFFVFGIIEASTYGWWNAKQILTIGNYTFNFNGLSVTPIALLLGILILALFVVWEQLICHLNRTPLVNMKLFTNRQFTSGATVTGIMSLGQAGLVFAVPVFLQAVRNLDAFHTGLSLLPMSLALLVFAPISAYMSKHFAPKHLIQAGLLVNSIAAVVLRYTLNVNTTSADLIFGLALYGSGFGLMISSISNLTLSAVSVEEAGEASGVNNTLRQVGQSFGSAIIGAVLLTTLATNLASGVSTSNVIPAQAKPAIQQAISSQADSFEFGGGTQASTESHLSPQINNEITNIAHQATVAGNRQALLYTALFSLLGFIVSFLLPNVKNVERNESMAVKPVSVH